MITIPVQSLKPGRLLASDVKNAHGQLLIKKGAEITERHLRVLMSWGIADVQVEGDGRDGEEPDGEKYDPALLERARGIVMEKMRHNSIEHPAVEELVRVCVLRKAHQLHTAAS